MFNTVDYILFIWHLAFPNFHEESFRFIFWFIFRFAHIQAVNAIHVSILWCVCIGLITLGLFLLLFPLLLFWDGFIVRFHSVYLLCHVIELDGIGALVAAGAGWLVFKWLLCDMLFGVVLKTWSSPRRPLRSHSMVCIKNHLFIVVIGPILNK